MLMTAWGLVGVKVTAHSMYMPTRSGRRMGGGGCLCVCMGSAIEAAKQGHATVINQLSLLSFLELAPFVYIRH